MGRKPQRRYFPNRRSAGPARADDSERKNRVDAAAQQLASRHTLEQLQALLADRAALFEQADQTGMNDPSPINLARYRSARLELEVARQAVELAREHADG